MASCFRAVSSAVDGALWRSRLQRRWGRVGTSPLIRSSEAWRTDLCHVCVPTRSNCPAPPGSSQNAGHSHCEAPALPLRRSRPLYRPLAVPTQCKPQAWQPVPLPAAGPLPHAPRGLTVVSFSCSSSFTFSSASTFSADGASAFASLGPASSSGLRPALCLAAVHSSRGPGLRGGAQGGAHFSTSRVGRCRREDAQKLLIGRSWERLPRAVSTRELRVGVTGGRRGGSAWRMCGCGDTEGHAGGPGGGEGHTGGVSRHGGRTGDAQGTRELSPEPAGDAAACPS